MGVEDWLPYAVLGAVGVGAILALRSSPPLVVGSAQPPPEDPTPRLEAAVRLAELAVARDTTRLQAEYEARTRMAELETARETARLQAETARFQAEYEARTRMAELETARETARLQAEYEARTRMAELETAREMARLQAEYEAKVRMAEIEAEKRRIKAEKEIAQKSADSQFWGSFWSGLFGLVGNTLGLLVGLSDEKLYQKALPYPPYIPPGGGELAFLARRDYGRYE